MNSVLTFIKKNLRDVILFGVAAIVSIVLLAVFLSWTVKGNKETTVQVRTATLVCENGLQTEYLVRQQFSADGASLDIGGGELIPIEECGINADFSSAGEKTVEIVYRKNDYLSFTAKIKVNVLFVRGIEVESYPDVVTVDGGTATADEKLEVYATLAQAPSTDRFGDAEKTEFGYKIKLDDGLYTKTCVQDTSLESFYTISFFCGDVSTGFSFYNAAGKSYIVSSTKDVVLYDSVSDDPARVADGSALTLIVTDRDDSYQYDCNGTTKGYYVYRNADGEESEHAFAYALEDVKNAATGVTVTEERLLSEGVAEENTGETYTAEIDGRKFAADAAIWQSAVVNGLIFDDGGYKLVIGSDKRILRFDYIPKAGELPDEPDADEQDALDEPSEPSIVFPTLTLYVTEYDMNPTLGTGNGYSQGVYIYTARDGRSHKIPFFMQAWVWTFVPLSSSHGDVYSEASVNDLVMKQDESGNWHYNTYFRGDIYSEVSMQDRQAGLVKDNFVAAEEFWLNAIMGM